jgi:anaerobic selenocysteine-containing dehydrogenase
MDGDERTNAREETPAAFSRRNFLELVSGTAVLAAAGCSGRDRGAMVPYTRRPVEIVPGVASYYASSFQECTRAYSVLVKTREGRPIHITGNDEHSRLRGKTSPRTVADVLRLYDPDRLKAPRIRGRQVSWPEADGRLRTALQSAKAAGSPVLLVTGAVLSPSRRALLAQVKAALPTLEHLAWEPAAGDAHVPASPSREDQSDPLSGSGLPQQR